MTDIVVRLRLSSFGAASEAAAEIERLREAKRAALKIADERSKENVALRAALQEIASMTMDEPMRGVARRALEPPTPQAFIEAKKERDDGWPGQF